jgi:Niemann-Pick C1 protein
MFLVFVVLSAFISISCSAHAVTFVAEWFAFIGRQAGLDVPGSPYAIRFHSDVTESSGMKPMNVSTYSCGDISLGCSCGDCPSSPVCSNTAPTASHKRGTCLVRIGSLKVREHIVL